LRTTRKFISEVQENVEAPKPFNSLYQSPIPPKRIQFQSPIYLCSSYQASPKRPNFEIRLGPVARKSTITLEDTLVSQNNSQIRTEEISYSIKLSNKDFLEEGEVTAALSLPRSSKYSFLLTIEDQKLCYYGPLHNPKTDVELVLLPCNTIFCTLVDIEGKVWCSGDTGLFLLDSNLQFKREYNCLFPLAENSDKRPSNLTLSPAGEYLYWLNLPTSLHQIEVSSGSILAKFAANSISSNISILRMLSRKYITSLNENGTCITLYNLSQKKKEGGYKIQGPLNQKNAKIIDFDSTKKGSRIVVLGEEDSIQTAESAPFLVVLKVTSLGFFKKSCKQIQIQQPQRILILDGENEVAVASRHGELIILKFSKYELSIATRIEGIAPNGRNLTNTK